MNNTFDLYEFECTLINMFEEVDLDRSEIQKAINKRLAEDTQFAQDYETWMDETAYESWKPYLKALEDEAKSIMGGDLFPNDDDDEEHELPSWMKE